MAKRKSRLNRLGLTEKEAEEARFYSTREGKEKLAREARKRILKRTTARRKEIAKKFRR
tara:strand:+ start:7670 stop:7846 length:177 start_codon:yes stop_codon:yes gene_type:complete